MSLVIVDTGCANISSVYCAFQRLGVDAKVSRDLTVIKNASRLLVPGVGAARQAMANLRERDLIATLQQAEQPLLGICLGMQLLTDRSEEGDVDCLGLIPGQVKRMQVGDLRLPHMGWNTLQVEQSAQNHPLLKGIGAKDYVYFVHSFAVAPSDTTLARCHYGSDFAAVIGQGNKLGAQFHPERSGAVGARLLQNFLAFNG
ncbi:imidazole glycerol phosphate synthase subunit HisH [Rheinheimera sp.]|jgi:glutamine amidotransferase|uniref:imidazole glycerol phosphate synthase subunit HisH n=1 Tax=Rheinheimera sp. TaxID=1869214 RepID=UPI0026148716|nr:imidazole glycerol phosphate synthase subunit HisH [Rheinheimera sp.]MCA1931665.1 imidazole glycerol phosphate synthase subunit HisH [Rheinheimera sp.]